MSGRVPLEDFNSVPRRKRREVTARGSSMCRLLSRGDPGPTPWLVENLIVDRAITAVVGRWKTTKWYGVLDICIALRPAARVRRFEIPEPGPVVFVNEDRARRHCGGGSTLSAAAARSPPDELRNGSSSPRSVA